MKTCEFEIHKFLDLRNDTSSLLTTKRPSRTAFISSEAATLSTKEKGKTSSRRSIRILILTSILPKIIRVAYASSAESVEQNRDTA